MHPGLNTAVGGYGIDARQQAEQLPNLAASIACFARLP